MTADREKEPMPNAGTHFLSWVASSPMHVIILLVTSIFTQREPFAAKVCCWLWSLCSSRLFLMLSNRTQRLKRILLHRNNWLLRWIGSAPIWPFLPTALPRQCLHPVVYGKLSQCRRKHPSFCHLVAQQSWAHRSRRSNLIPARRGWIHR